jgi:hypothetical protein
MQHGWPVRESHRRLGGVLVALALSVPLAAGPAHAEGSWAPRLLMASLARTEGRRAQGPRTDVLHLALQAYACGRAHGLFSRSLLTVIDYSRPSVERRLWVLDPESGQMLFHELVAHGRNSGETYAHAFSNRPGSKQSSLGLFRTEETYYGRHGYSLRLAGLESGINDRARERAIVMHGAPYVTRAFAARHGRLGRSWGCPALDLSVHHDIIDRIKDGSALFAYFPDDEWLRQSPFLHCDQPVSR